MLQRKWARATGSVWTSPNSFASASVCVCTNYYARDAFMTPVGGQKSVDASMGDLPSLELSATNPFLNSVDVVSRRILHRDNYVAATLTA